ncbi:hypothetical protein BpHYR1_027627 [Brachionus plicatilis]|uniref:Uncharacterized protein n=1 Tax=Brachionus plicatilis TaxID=10195 RepID=A0A3M7PGR7_BRAPC|nr:hypothetical protein BpHYR1_027627 [Brachionus plicatilis]
MYNANSYKTRLDSHVELGDVVILTFKNLKKSILAALNLMQMLNFLLNIGLAGKIVIDLEKQGSNLGRLRERGFNDIERSEVLRMEFLFIPIFSCQEHELIINSRC